MNQAFPSTIPASGGMFFYGGTPSSSSGGMPQLSGSAVTSSRAMQMKLSTSTPKKEDGSKPSGAMPAKLKFGMSAILSDNGTSANTSAPQSPHKTPSPPQHMSITTPVSNNNNNPSHQLGKRPNMHLISPHFPGVPSLHRTGVPLTGPQPHNEAAQLLAAFHHHNATNPNTIGFEAMKSHLFPQGGPLFDSPYLQGLPDWWTQLSLTGGSSLPPSYLGLSHPFSSMSPSGAPLGFAHPSSGHGLPSIFSCGGPGGGYSFRPKPRRAMLRRAVFSDNQRKGLETAFTKHAYITKPDRKELAEKLGLKDAQVKIWFQNRRMKWRNAKEREQLVPAGGGATRNLSGASNTSCSPPHDVVDKVVSHHHHRQRLDLETDDDDDLVRMEEDVTEARIMLQSPTEEEDDDSEEEGCSPLMTSSCSDEDRRRFLHASSLFLHAPMVGVRSLEDLTSRRSAKEEIDVT